MNRPTQKQVQIVHSKKEKVEFLVNFLIERGVFEEFRALTDTHSNYYSSFWELLEVKSNMDYFFCAIEDAFPWTRSERGRRFWLDLNVDYQAIFMRKF